MSNIKCPFCYGDESKVENHVIFQTKDFKVKPALGELVEGYLMVVPNYHIDAFSFCSKEELKKLRKLIDKLKKIIFDEYGIEPFVYEHGTGSKSNKFPDSVTHAHIHIIPHKIKDEQAMLDYLQMTKVDSFYDISKLRDENYFYYENQKGEMYVKNLYDRKDLRQYFRIQVAKEIGIPDKWQWREHFFIDKIENTVKKLSHLEKNLD
jgi:diadenosine tetraphosphate (Ap4A) HIT family hydrolase